MSNYKYMEVKYTLTPEGKGFRWKVSDKGLNSQGFGENKRIAKEGAERWIKGALK